MTHGHESDPFNFHRDLAKRRFDNAPSMRGCIEQLVADFDEEFRPLRESLNRVITAGPERWADALFEAGPSIGEYPAQTQPSGESAQARVRSYLLDLVRAAASQDREKFNRILHQLESQPGLAGYIDRNRAKSGEVWQLPFIAVHVLNRKATPTGNKYVERVAAALADHGFSNDDCVLREQFRECGIELSEGATVLCNALGYPEEYRTPYFGNSHSNWIIPRLREPIVWEPATPAIMPERSNTPIAAAGAGDRKNRKSKTRKPKVPEKYKKAVKAAVEYRQECKKSGKRFRLADAVAVSARKGIIVNGNEFISWWNGTYKGGRGG
jgi:hypothetical protein